MAPSQNLASRQISLWSHVLDAQLLDAEVQPSSMHAWPHMLTVMSAPQIVQTPLSNSIIMTHVHSLHSPKFSKFRLNHRHRRRIDWYHHFQVSNLPGQSLVSKVMVCPWTLADFAWQICWSSWRPHLCHPSRCFDSPCPYQTCRHSRTSGTSEPGPPGVATTPEPWYNNINIAKTAVHWLVSAECCAGFVTLVWASQCKSCTHLAHREL